MKSLAVLDTMKKLIYLSIIFAIWSCEQQNIKSASNENPEKDSTETIQKENLGTSIQDEFPKVFRTNSIQDLIDVFNTDSNGHYERIGFTGEYSEKWAAFLRLKEIGAEEDFNNLIKDSSTVVRAYAYLAIIDNIGSLDDLQLMNLESDSAEIMWFSGDLGMGWKLNQFIEYKINEKDSVANKK